MWVLVCAAAAMLALFKVGSHKLQQRKQQGQAPVQAAAAGEAASGVQAESGEEVRALTRLTQEAFTELVKVKQRLDELEQEPGIASSTAPAGSTRLSTAGGGAGAGQQQVPHGRHHRLAGVLRMGGGLLWAPDGGAAGAADALRGAGLKLGSDALVQLAGAARGGRDSVHAECQLDPAAERLTLRKVLYNCRLGQRLRLVLAPFGARGRDAAYTLNPLTGQGLSSMVRDGSPLHRPVLGSLAGVALEAPRAWFNAGYFARAQPEGGAAASLLAQLVVAPTNSLSLGVTFLGHRSEARAAAGGTLAPPAATEAAAEDVRQLSDVGSTQHPALVGVVARAAGVLAEALGSAAADSRQLGATLALRLGQDAVIHGWAAADADEVEACVRAGRMVDAARPREWGLVLGGYPDGTGNGWTLGVGRSAAVAAALGSGTGGEGSTPLLPNLYELSLQWNLGEGLLLSPGMLLVARGDEGGVSDATAFLGMRSTWAF